MQIFSFPSKGNIIIIYKPYKDEREVIISKTVNLYSELLIFCQLVKICFFSVFYVINMVDIIVARHSFVGLSIRIIFQRMMDLEIVFLSTLYLKHHW